MNQNFKVLETVIEGNKFVRFGPSEPSLGFGLEAPEKLLTRISYPAWGCILELYCVFLNSRLGIERIILEATNPTDRTINSSLTQNLEISKVMREVCLTSFPKSEVWADRSSQDRGPHIASDEFLAQIYWFENATWGKPRLALMNYMNWSRTNANWHIKRLAKMPNIGMPSMHAQSSETARKNKRQRDKAV